MIRVEGEGYKEQMDFIRLKLVYSYVRTGEKENKRTRDLVYPIV